jgi:hypothetical protein
MPYRQIHFNIGERISYVDSDGLGNRAVIVITLQQLLTLSGNTFLVGSAQGHLIGNVIGTTAGSTITFNSLSIPNSIQLANVAGTWQIQVGPSVTLAPVTITFNLVETLSMAVNSPQTSMEFVVAVSSDSLNLGIHLTANSVPISA